MPLLFRGEHCVTSRKTAAKETGMSYAVGSVIGKNFPVSTHLKKTIVNDVYSEGTNKSIS